MERSRVVRRLPFITYAVAVLAGLALVFGFARFNALHEAFLAANFDSVHGARTLLKARYFLGQAQERLERAEADPEARAEQLVRADAALGLAENYGAEGEDGEPRVRQRLTARIAALRASLAGFDSGDASPPAATTALLAHMSADVRRLAADFEAAELDRWGMLSSLNAELAARMEAMRLFIAAIVAGFVALMALLGWALLRARGAEAALRRAKEEVEAIQQTTLDASAIGIAYVEASDPGDRRITLANRHMGALFGCPAGELVGLSTSELYPDRESYERITREVLPCLGKGEVLRTEARMRQRDGGLFWCGMSGKAIDPANPGRGVVWTFEDISVRKAAEAELREARERAEAASKAKSDFLANMSHEIRTPFTGILGVLDLLRDTALTEKQQHYLRLARGSASQLLAIVNDILDLSRIEAGKLVIRLEDFDLRKLLEDAAQVHGAAAALKSLAFEPRFMDAMPALLHGDPLRLRQIVDNLASNAVKFTPSGRVTMTVRWRADSELTGRLRVEVEDTGIGIPEEIQERIFEHFTQADSSTTRLYGGSGLGLAICRQLVALMDGRLGVESRPGVGSLFWFEVPLGVVAQCAGARQDSLVAPSDAALQGVRVVLADDVEVSQEVLGEHLRRLGCTVRGARNGEQAVALVREWQPDLVLMDCQMPGMDGYDATHRIRELEGASRRTPVIALTAHAMNGDRTRCLAAGMDDYLSKPVDGGTLLATLQRWMALSRSQADEEGSPALAGRVLLVDDDEAIREASRGLLEAMGCEVVLAASGKEALERGFADDELDLVLLDCRMPEMDGWETSRAWRTREKVYGRSPTAIIALTADARDESVERCRAAGMDDFLGKPFSPLQLRNLLGRWLGPAAPG